MKLARGGVIAGNPKIKREKLPVFTDVLQLGLYILFSTKR
jgi:hypothetical protein